MLVPCQEFQYYTLVNLISRQSYTLLYSSDTSDHRYVMIIVYCKKKKEKNNTGSTILTVTHINIVTDSSNLYQLTQQTGSSVKASDMYLWGV